MRGVGGSELKQALGEGGGGGERLYSQEMYNYVYRSTGVPDLLTRARHNRLHHRGAIGIDRAKHETSYPNEEN